MGANLGPILAGISAVIMALVAAVGTFRPKPEPEPPSPEQATLAVSAREDVALRIEILKATIHELQGELERCRSNRNAADERADELQAEVEELQMLLGACRMERQRLLRQQKDGGTA